MLKLYKLSALLTFVIGIASCAKTPQSGLIISHPGPKTISNIVILGSSTAAGVGATPVDSSWANRLQAITNQHGTKFNFINLAVPNYVTYQVMPNGYYAAGRPAPDTAHNITKALSYNPALVIINLPSNDIADNYSDQETMNNYAALCHTLDAAGVKFIIFGTQPRNFPDSAERVREQTLNTETVNTYTSNSTNVFGQLSTPALMIAPAYSAGDGIHLNNAGHAVILNAVLNNPVFTSVSGQ